MLLCLCLVAVVGTSFGLTVNSLPSSPHHQDVNWECLEKMGVQTQVFAFRGVKMGQIVLGIAASEISGADGLIEKCSLQKTCPAGSFGRNCGNGDLIFDEVPVNPLGEMSSSCVDAAYRKLSVANAADGRAVVFFGILSGPVKWDCLPKAAQELYTDGKDIMKPYFIENEHNLPNVQSTWNELMVDSMIERALQKDKHLSQYERASGFFYEAFTAFPLKGLDVLVVGSIQPWAESIALAYGASSVLTSEFLVPHSQHPLISTVHSEHLNANPVKFDAVISYSSIEHDGLGRFGDPLSPNGDICQMAQMRENLTNEGGLLFLGIPIGTEKLLWNANRVYGISRLEKLLEGWEVLGIFGGVGGAVDLHRAVHLGTSQGDMGWQPVIVLRRIATTTTTTTTVPSIHLSVTYPKDHQRVELDEWGRVFMRVDVDGAVVGAIAQQGQVLLRVVVNDDDNTAILAYEDTVTLFGLSPGTVKVSIEAVDPEWREPVEGVNVAVTTFEVATRSAQAPSSLKLIPTASITTTTSKAPVKISCLHATRGRRDKAMAAAAKYFDLAKHGDRVEWIFAIDRDEVAEWEGAVVWNDDATNAKKTSPKFGSTTVGDDHKAKIVVVAYSLFYNESTCTAAWNTAAMHSTGDILVVVADDLLPPHHWDQQLQDRLPLNKPLQLIIDTGDALASGPRVFVSASGNVVNYGNLQSHPVMNRNRYKQRGFVYYPEFKSVYCDDDLTLAAYVDEVALDGREVQFQHNHPAVAAARAGDSSTLTEDKLHPTTARNNAPERYTHGRLLFDLRGNAGVDRKAIWKHCWSFVAYSERQHCSSKDRVRSNIKLSLLLPVRVNNTGNMVGPDAEVLMKIAEELQEDGVELVVGDGLWRATIAQVRNVLIDNAVGEYIVHLPILSKETTGLISTVLKAWKSHSKYNCDGLWLLRCLPDTSVVIGCSHINKISPSPPSNCVAAIGSFLINPVRRTISALVRHREHETDADYAARLLGVFALEGDQKDAPPPSASAVTIHIDTPMHEEQVFIPLYEIPSLPLSLSVQGCSISEDDHWIAIMLDGEYIDAIFDPNFKGPVGYNVGLGWHRLHAIVLSAESDRPTSTSEEVLASALASVAVEFKLSISPCSASPLPAMVIMFSLPASVDTPLNLLLNGKQSESWTWGQQGSFVLHNLEDASDISLQFDSGLVGRFDHETNKWVDVPTGYTVSSKLLEDGLECNMRLPSPTSPWKLQGTTAAAVVVEGGRTSWADEYTSNKILTAPEYSRWNKMHRFEPNGCLGSQIDNTITVQSSKSKFIWPNMDYFAGCGGNAEYSEISLGYVVYPGTVYNDQSLVNLMGPCEDRSLAKPKPISTISFDTIIILGQFWGENFYHWMIECLPRIVVIPKHILQNPSTVIAVIESPPHVIETLALFGITSEQRIVHMSRETSFRGKTVILPSPGVCGVGPSGSMLRKMGEELLLAMNLHQDNNGINRQRPIGLVVMRRGMRQLENHGELYAALINKFPEIQWEEYETPSGRDAIRHAAKAFSQASIIVSPHGGQLGNLVFCRRETTKILEFLADDKPNLCYERLASALALRYKGMIIAGSRHDGLLHVNVAEAIAAVEDILLN